MTSFSMFGCVSHWHYETFKPEATTNMYITATSNYPEAPTNMYITCDVRSGKGNRKSMTHWLSNITQLQKYYLWVAITSEIWMVLIH